MIRIVTAMRIMSVLAVVACHAAAEQKEKSQTDALESSLQGTRIEIAVVERVSAESNLRFTGEVRGSRDAMLASSTGGLIEKVKVEAGESVSRGQTLITIDRELAQARLRQVAARAALASSETSRLEQLGDGTSPAQLERAKTDAEIASAGLREAEILLKRSSITAPFAGVVGDINAEAGEYAAPGSPLVRLLVTDPVLVRVTVSDRDVVALRDGMEVEVFTAARPTPLVGHLTGIRSAANPQTRAFTVDVSVPNASGGLLPGMLAEVTTHISLGDQFVIPQDWVVMKGNKRGVFVEVEGRASWRDIELGQVLRNQVVVQSGIQPGDNLIFVGHRELLDGDAVLVTRTARCCEQGRPVYE